MFNLTVHRIEPCNTSLQHVQVMLVDKDTTIRVINYVTAFETNMLWICK